MTIDPRLPASDRARAYAEGVVAGKIPAAKYVIAACDRYLQLHKEFDYKPGQADARAALIEALDLPEGQHAKFVLLPYQCLIICFLYAFRDGKGHRAIHRLLLEVPRKSGKTSLKAGILIGELLSPLGNTKNPSLIAAGVNERTAGHAFYKAVSMIRQDGQNDGTLAEDYELSLRAKEIHCGVTGGKLEMLSAGARTLDGFTCSICTFDEIAMLKDGAEIRKLYSGMSHDPNHLLLMASTQAEIPASALEVERDTCINLLTEEKKRAQYIGLIYSADVDDDWTAESTWAKVQPRLYDDGTGSTLDFYRGQCEDAKANAEVLDNFLMRQLCVPIGGGQAWLRVNEYDDIPRLAPDDEPPADWTHFVGIDMSDHHDASSLCLLSVSPDGDRLEARFDLFYVHNDGVMDDGGGGKVNLRPSALNQKYRRLADAGHAIMTSGALISGAMVAGKIKEYAKRVKIRGLFSDHYHSLEDVRKHLPPELDRLLTPIPKNSRTLSGAIRYAEERIKLRTLRIDPNPLVREHFLNAKAIHYELGGLLIQKATRTSPFHIDAADAFIQAIAGRDYIYSNDKFVGTGMRPIDNETGGKAEDAEDFDIY